MAFDKMQKDLQICL